MWNAAVLIVSEEHLQVGFPKNRAPRDKGNVYSTSASRDTLHYVFVKCGLLLKATFEEITSLEDEDQEVS